MAKGVSLVISPWTCSLRSATSGSMETTSSTSDTRSELDEERGNAVQPNPTALVKLLQYKQS